VPSRTVGINPRAIPAVIVQKPKKTHTTTPGKTATVGGGGASESKSRHGIEGVKSTAHNPIRAPLREINLPQMMCPYFDTFEFKDCPQYAQVWNAKLQPVYVESQFGTVPKGSVLSYQHQLSLSHSESYLTMQNMPSPPPLIFPDLSAFMVGYLPLSESQSVFYDSLYASEIQCKDFEELTRDQSDSEEWHKLRSKRLTASKFKRICARRADFGKLATDLLKTKNIQTAAMKYGIEHEGIAAESYAKLFAKNVYRVGFIINPTCTFLGCSPDRYVLEVNGAELSWGLLEIKCSTADSLAECKFLCNDKNTGKLQLKRSHDYYYQVMGQMGITGYSWCDLFVSTQTEHHLERIEYDEAFFSNMMQKLCSFYFVYFLPACTAIV
jgi:hypothetical protein